MTKQELMETYTAEQLAEMVAKADFLVEMLKYSGSFAKSELFDNPEVAAYESKLSIMQHENDKLKSEVEKYRKAFEDAKKERDCQIAEHQNRVDKDKTEIERAKNTINQIDYILEKLFGVRHDTVDTPDEFEKILSDKAKGNIANFLPTEPIKVADMLINAEGEYEQNPLAKAFCGTDKGTYRIFDISELRQIAEHLLVYCNHNGEAEE